MHDTYLIYCNGSSYIQLCILIFRSCVRIFGLLWGILQINSRPKKLGKILNYYCDWKEDKQQMRIMRLKTILEEYSGFKVCGVAIREKHFIALMVTALTSCIMALIKTKLTQEFVR